MTGLYYSIYHWVLARLTVTTYENSFAFVVAKIPPKYRVQASEEDRKKRFALQKINRLYQLVNRFIISKYRAFPQLLLEYLYKTSKNLGNGMTRAGQSKKSM